MIRNVEALMAVRNGGDTSIRNYSCLTAYCPHRNTRSLGNFYILSIATSFTRLAGLAHPHSLHISQHPTVVVR